MKNIYKNTLYTLIIALGLLVLVPVASAAQNGGTADATSASSAGVTTSVAPTIAPLDSTVTSTRGDDIPEEDCTERGDCIEEPKELSEPIPVEDRVFCTQDAKQCSDGSYVSRVAPSCQFAECLGGDDQARGGFIKIDDIKGESNKAEFKTTPNSGEVISPRGSEDVDSEASRIYIKIDDVKGESNAKKPEEIVVVGSKIQEAIQAGVQVRGWDPVKKEVLIRTGDVNTKEALTDYAVALLASSEEIDSVVVDDERVSIVYTQPVKLFGFLPVAMEQTVDADTEGRVKVSFPWWSFLAKKTTSVDEIESAIDAERKVVKVQGEIVLIQEGDKKFQGLSGLLKVVYDVAMNPIRNVK